MIDPLYAMETVLTHFYKKALLAKYRGAADDVVDAAMLKAIEVAEKVAPYRHAKYATIKLASDPNAPLHVNADASSEEIRAEIIKHLGDNSAIRFGATLVSDHSRLPVEAASLKRAHNLLRPIRRAKKIGALAHRIPKGYFGCWNPASSSR